MKTKNYKLLILFLVFVLSINIVYSIPSEPFIRITASSLNTSAFNINSCEINSETATTWFLNCSGVSEVARARMYKTLFYGIDGTNPAILQATSVSKLETSDSGDVGKRAYYMYAHWNSDDTVTRYVTGTFGSVTNNIVSSWSYCNTARSDLAKWELPQGTILNQAFSDSTFATSDETEADTSSEDKTNPTNFRMYVSTSSIGSAFDVTTKVFMLTNSTFSTSVTSCTYTQTDFYTTYSIPLLTLYVSGYQKKINNMMISSINFLTPIKVNNI